MGNHGNYRAVVQKLLLLNDAVYLPYIALYIQCSLGKINNPCNLGALAGNHRDDLLVHDILKSMIILKDFSNTTSN